MLSIFGSVVLFRRFRNFGLLRGFTNVFCMSKGEWCSESSSGTEVKIKDWSRFIAETTGSLGGGFEGI